MANNLVGRDMAVDLGTANTLVYVRGRGVLVDEPSVVAVNETTGELVAVGHDAKRMIGRTPEDITVIRPLQDGVIADFEATEQMLRHFIALVHRRRYFAKPRMVVCVPSGITAVEQRAVKEAGYQAGARRVFIIEEPMAAAIGAGLPVHQATGNMVVDVGGGTTEVAVISLGGIVTSLSVRTAGDELDRAITTLDEEGARAAARRGHRRGGQDDPRLGVPRARSTPRPRSAAATWSPGCRAPSRVTSAEVRTAIEEPLHAIIDAVRVTLDQTPPELAGDIMDRGIVLTGGGALLRGLDERLRHETGMPVHVAEDPLTSVALGAGRCVEEFEALQQVFVRRAQADRVTDLLSGRRDRAPARAPQPPRQPRAPRAGPPPPVAGAGAGAGLPDADDPRPASAASPRPSTPPAASSARSTRRSRPAWTPCSRPFARGLGLVAHPGRGSSRTSTGSRPRTPQLRGELGHRRLRPQPAPRVRRPDRDRRADRLRAGARPGWSASAPPRPSRGPSPSTPAPAPGCART